jgi:WD40 repeat protein
MRCSFFLCVIAMALPVLGADDPETPNPVSFCKDVAPILVKNCLGCHNAKKAEGGLNMATFALLKKGGKSYGAMILEPGSPDASSLIELVRPDGEPRMPYKKEPLSENEIKILERWVQQGATFDGPSEAETPLAALVDPLKGLPKITVKVPTADPITALAFSIDGQTLAAGQGRTVLLFDLTTGKLNDTLTEHPGQVTAVRFTPDGKTLMVAGGRSGMFGAVTIWDLAGKTKQFDLRGHADSILAADLAPDGKTLATSSYDRLVKLWDIEAGRELRTLKEHTDAVYAVAFAPDGKTLASAGGDRTVKLWDVATGHRLVSLSEPTAEVYAVTFGPEGKAVFAGGVDRSIRAWRWDGKAATLERTVFAHDAALLRLLVAPDGATLYSSGEDKEVKLWDLGTLEPRSALTDQSDWPQAIALSPDGTRLAVGRYDGSLAVYDPKVGKIVLALRDAPGVAPSQPAEQPRLVRNASLNPISPRGATRGTTLRATLTGVGVGQASSVLFQESGITAQILPAAKPDPNRLEVELTVAADAREGIHMIGAQTPLGVTPFQPFAVSAYPEVQEVEPDDEPGAAKLVSSPATLMGMIERPGDRDHFRFAVKAGQEWVFETTARNLGSALNGALMLLDDAGHVLAEAQDFDGGLDPVLWYKTDRDRVVILRVLDADLGGSGSHFYRIAAGTIPFVASVFPLGVSPGKTTTIEVKGLNLGDSTALPLTVPQEAEPGSIREVPIPGLNGSRPSRTPKVVVAEGESGIEAEPNEEPAKAATVAVPGGVSGRIDAEGDVDLYRFEAKKGRRLIIEVYGRRLGSPIDPVIEILDEKGQTVPRAVLRPVEETAIAFRDHPSSGQGIRLTQWQDLAIGDYMLAGRELMRIFALPRNPDDDAIFWGVNGARVGFLETTPEHHPMGQPIYKVEIHPPGTTVPPGGTPPITLGYRNDDGGPGFGKDARITFDPPADGIYFARVEDVRGFGGERFGYHLVIRGPRPDFRLTVHPENPNVPRGGSMIITATITRIDGFEGPVDVGLEGLPSGITATATTIEAEQASADLLLMAAAAAPATSPPTWKAVARASLVTSNSTPEEIGHEFDPGGSQGGWITVTPAPDLKVAARPERIRIRPGERVEVTFQVERKAPFTGRVPIDVRNLPHGVRVLNIGLNGVLVTEAQTERTVFLYAEPWVAALERPFFAEGRLEVLGKPMGGLGAPVIDSSRAHSSLPIWLVVEPRAAGSRHASAATIRP